MTLVSAVVPSIGSAGTVGGKQRTFVVESIRSVLATANVDIDVIVVAGREMPSSVTDELRELGPVRIVDYEQVVQLLRRRQPRCRARDGRVPAAAERRHRSDHR